MTNVKQTKNINDFFISFLKRVSDEDGELQIDETLEDWNSKENQAKLLKLIKKTVKKPRKDPTKPKRGKSSYIFFCQDQRSAAKANLTNPTSPQVTSELAKMWRELKASSDKTQMKRYVKEAENDKVRYQKQMLNYVPQDMTKKVKKDPNKPKRSKSSYIFFCSSHRAEVKEDLNGSTATEVVRELGRLWGELKIDESKKGKKEMAELAKLATQDKKRFALEMAKYNSKSDTESDSKSDVESDSKSDTESDTEIKTKVGDFKMFAVGMRSDFKVRFPTLKASQITAKMGKAWRELGEDDKQKWVK